MRSEGPELRISQQAVAVNRAENAPQGEKFSLKDYSAVEDGAMPELLLVTKPFGGVLAATK